MSSQSVMNVVKWADPTYYYDQNHAFGISTSKPKDTTGAIVNEGMKVVGKDSGTMDAVTTPMPAAVQPDVSKVEDANTAYNPKAPKSVARRRGAVQQTSFAGTLGLGTAANMARKTLLGV